MKPLSIDVHLLLSGHTQPAWQAQARDSLRAAAERSPFPVHIHELPGVPGHLGRARMRGYARGDAPYVTHVDDDDYILPEAFETIARYLEQRPDALFTREYVEQNGVRRPGALRHHICVYHRNWLFDQRQWRVYGDSLQIDHASRAPHVVDVDIPLYVHRLYGDSSCRAMRRDAHEEYRRYREFDLTSLETAR